MQRWGLVDLVWREERTETTPHRATTRGRNKCCFGSWLLQELGLRPVLSTKRTNRPTNQPTGLRSAVSPSSRPTIYYDAVRLSMCATVCAVPQEIADAGRGAGVPTTDHPVLRHGMVTVDAFWQHLHSWRAGRVHAVVHVGRCARAGRVGQTRVGPVV